MNKTARVDLKLGIPGFSYADLYRPERLTELLQHFDETLNTADDALFTRFNHYRENGSEMEAPEVSNLLVAVAPHLGNFLATLFKVEDTQKNSREITERELESQANFRRGVVAGTAKRFKKVDVSEWDLAQVETQMKLLLQAGFLDLNPEQDREDATMVAGARLLALAKHYERIAKNKAGEYGEGDPEQDCAAIRSALAANTEAAATFANSLAAETSEDFIEGLMECLMRWTHAAGGNTAISATVKGWAAFKSPSRTNFSALLQTQCDESRGYPVLTGPLALNRARDGFALTDQRYDARAIHYEVDRCIYCHERDTDSCNKGIRNKDGSPRSNPLNVPTTGCPLGERISEANLLKRHGDNIAALAMVIIDNPMVPGTGHRICNDCMKACIYQKVEAVNIPQIETNVLTDVLFMPWGFEIYSLLTRWNPLNIARPVALPYNGKKVLVVGMGPAGYTLSHYLLNEGFSVTGIDGLKIEPLPESLTGKAGECPPPLRNFSEIYDDLDTRIMAGFGGVAEYGITVRWDKNFLKVIYLTLARRNAFHAYGGVRFGGTLSIEDAWALGFDHIAIASGAGEPTVIRIKNNLIRGIRKASDFLMGLQLTGAAKHSSLANLQVRLPAGVVGGGLTAIDTTTELMAYYPVQVEKILHRHEILLARYGKDTIRERMDQEDCEILDEFIEHGRAIRAERELAKSEGRAPDFAPLVNSWGGVTLYYRRPLEDAPSYRQNHEEIQKALEEQISIAPYMNPVEATPDEHGHLSTVNFERTEYRDEKLVGTGKHVTVPLRALFVAAGTSPNIIYQRENPGTFEQDGKFYRSHDLDSSKDGFRLVPAERTGPPKFTSPAPFTSYQEVGKYISYFGDNHPVYVGNVVKAMASAKHGYPHIARLFEAEIATLKASGQAARDTALANFQSQLDGRLITTVVEVNRLSPTIIEVVLHAPQQAEKFQPGQFFRAQSMESLATTIEGTRLASEGMALTGAWVDREKGLVAVIVLEMGSSSRLCATWQPGERIILMGPTGLPTEIPHNKTILLAGGGLGNAVLFSIGKAMRDAGNRVIYFAGYRLACDTFKTQEVEDAADVVVWAVDPLPGNEAIIPRRPQDRTFVGNIIQAMVHYAEGKLGSAEIPLDEVDHLIAIGSHRMMGAVKAERTGLLKPYLKKDPPIAYGSINSTMQCMMKGVCAQCMCRHEDPETGKESFVYSCFNQDQLLDEVDFNHLDGRLRQNSVPEKLSNLWLTYLMEQQDIPRI